MRAESAGDIPGVPLMFTAIPANVIADSEASNHMPTGRISKTTVDAAQVGAKDWLLWDDKLAGFGLKVTPSGGKVFVFQYRIGGRRAKVRRYTIGKFGRLTAEAARKVAEDLAFKVAKGIDPQSAKVEDARRSVDLAFNTYVTRFNKECLKVKWAASHDYAHSLLTNYAVPVLGSKPLTDIKRSDVRAVLAKVKGKTATARNLFSVIRRLFRWAVNEGDLETSPLDGMEPPLAPASRERVLSDAELKAVWRASQKLGYPFGPVVRLLILTGARREEVAALEWSELNHSAKLWTLPSSRAKNVVAHIVPLSALALTELDALAKRANKKAKDWPKSGFVFSTTGETSVSGYSRAKRRLDREIADLAVKDAEEGREVVTVAQWRLHDLRRSLATGMQRLGVRFEVTEAVLNHVSGSKSGVAGIYQRHDWGPEKRDALNLWSAFIDSTLAGYRETDFVSASGEKDVEAWRAFISGWAKRGGPPLPGADNVVSLAEARA